MNTTIFRNYPLNFFLYIYAFWRVEEIIFSKGIKQTFLEIIHLI
jgi:hypothetical protein